MTNEDMSVAIINLKAQISTINEKLSRVEKNMAEIPKASIDSSNPSELESIKSTMDSLVKSVNSLKIDVQKSMPKKAPITPSSGVKINYDADGIVRGSSDLTESDIPKLEIDHINGLREELLGVVTTIEFDKFKESIKKELKCGDTAYTYTKVNVDKNGNVTSGGKLIKSDIPNIDISQVEELDTTLASINESISTIRDMIRKLDSKPKNSVQMNSANGIVDVPESIKSEIRELSQAIFLINQRLNRRDLQFMDQVRTMIRGTTLNTENASDSGASGRGYLSAESVDKIIYDIRTSIVEIKTQLMNKADASNITALENYLNSVLCQLPDMQRIIQSADKIDAFDSQIVELNDKVMLLSNVPEEKPVSENQKIMKELDHINDMISYLMNYVTDKI